MFVLGIDPGLSRCGYGVVEQIAASGRQRSRIEAVALGVLTTGAAAQPADRLAAQMAELSGLLREFRPSVVAVERVFFSVNVRTAIGVAQVAGLAMALAAADGCEVAEYSPTQVKQAVAGWGGADKDQMMRMVASLLGLDEPPTPADAADAAAVALCHLAQGQLAEGGIPLDERQARPQARARLQRPAPASPAPEPAASSRLGSSRPAASASGP